MKKKEEIFEEDIANSVMQDFLKRQMDRKPFEAVWSLNENFYLGNQFARINDFMDIDESRSDYFWQERQVYNHIAPIIESRLAKLATVRPDLKILPTSNKKEDIDTAQLSQDILQSISEKIGLQNVISKVTEYSEIFGTGFYKITWDKFGGKKLSNDYQSFEGEVKVDAISPFEIYPDNNYTENIDDCESIIHAKAYSLSSIKRIYGIDAKGEEREFVNFVGNNKKVVKGDKTSIVIEKYEKPTIEHPNGRLIVVCEDKLLYMGELPYINNFSSKRGFPFVKQICLGSVNCFWGRSVIEKLIPIQRAYNAVKNRKQEFLNRLSMGVLMVEEGSIDIDDLNQDGLQPGKVIVYRSSSNPPKFLSGESLSGEFVEEEDRLLEEFAELGASTNIMGTQFGAKNLSGIAIELLIEQDTARLNTSIDQIKFSCREVARQILRLYKQFAVVPRLIKISNSDVSTRYFDKSDLGTEDFEFLDDSTINESLSQRRENLLRLISSGVVNLKDGEIPNALKRKICELFALNIWD